MPPRHDAPIRAHPTGQSVVDSVRLYARSKESVNALHRRGDVG
jgi:hypothetical protein